MPEVNRMDVKGIKTQADLYCLFKKIVAEKLRFDEIAYSRVELEYRIKQSRRRADLVLFSKEQNKNEKPFLVIETKRLKRKKSQNDYDWNHVILHPTFGKLTVREFIGKTIKSKGNYNYFSAALQQAQEYAEDIGAPFFAVCFAKELYVASFVEGLGLFYPSIDFTEEFGSKVLKELSQLYKKVKMAQKIK